MMILTKMLPQTDDTQGDAHNDTLDNDIKHTKNNDNSSYGPCTG